MAQQSKRKLPLKGSDPSTNEESFVKIGTPLPPLTSTKADQNVFVPIWKQEVTDEQGRRRLHGAFTGGFSAGYFNTVGSKDGWNPTEFKSSRTDKNRKGNRFSQKPSDFMDEEDLAELSQSKELKTNTIFGSTSEKPSGPSRQSYDPLTGTIEKDSDLDPFGAFARSSNTDSNFSDLIQPSNARAGYKIMRQMGWKDGQGIGPRITFARKLQLASKLGINLTEELDTQSDPERDKHLYAPIDRPLTAPQPWPGFSGLGYSKATHPFQQLRDSPTKTSTHDYNLEAKNGLKIPQGSSFGLGALNDTEDDDEDIYASASHQVTSDPRARRLLNLSDETVNIEKHPHLPTAKIPARSVQPEEKTFTDNTPLLKGFRLSINVNQELLSVSCDPPPIPETWEPCPKRIWEASTTSRQPIGGQPNHGHTSRPMNSHDRARLIGEQAPPKSVFDFISAKDKARLEDAKQLAQATSHSKIPKPLEGHESPVPEASIIVPRLDPLVAQAALRGFVPFSHDPPKQQRYILYLQSQAGMLPKDTQFSPKATDQMSVESINKELDGFAKSALMFKPMSAMMASRFTTAASTSAGGELPAPEPGLRQPVFQEETLEENAELAEDKDKEPETVSPAAQAVRMDIFGMLTRSVKTFYPQKLLCKRFNVPNPFPDGPPAEPVPKTSSNNLSDFLSSRGFQPATAPTDSDLENSKCNSWLEKQTDEQARQLTSQVGLAGDETQGREILTTTRPPIDLFKAIFADNSDDEGDNVEADDLIEDQKDVLHQASSKEDLEHNFSPIGITPQIISLTPVVVDPKAMENLTSFRPTFLRKGQAKDDNSVPEPHDLSSNKKKNHKKKKRPVLISFDEDQGDGQSTDGAESKKKKKKLAQDKTKANQQVTVQSSSNQASSQELHGVQKAAQDVNDQQEDEWVEAVVPMMPLHRINQPISNDTSTSAKTGVTTHRKAARMKAIDLMD